MRLPRRIIRSRTCHHNFYHSLFVIVIVPLWTAFDKRVVKVNADTPTHAHNHRLTVHSFQPPFKVCDNIIGNESQTLFGSHQCLKLSPFGLEFLLAYDLLPFGHFLKFRVNAGPFVLIQLNFGETSLIGNRNGGTVLNRTLYIVDADVISKNGAGVAVGLLNRCTCKTDKRGVGQRVARMPGKPVDKIVLAAMRLVCDNHNVPPVRQ